ncbi:Zinc finger protein 862 [Eumeta japonica]|uniref:Zinc finger protein 862 n=1 Tax=Eumeta variegata TaxID=151549 RepID=A0A4C1W3P7_EUMVA|nr:Zinc finger protein 862 [Eumeta japonica]
MTDEMTDVSTVKTACVVVRYFDQDAQKICSTFWELYKVFKQTSDTDDTSIPTANAENLYRALIDSLTNRNVPLTNMIGFGSDGCNVMMGDNDSVKTRFIRDFPGIIITKCVCHSAHLCASEACKQLPESVEQLARDIYNFFKHSDKRQFDFRNFQSFAAVEPHKILKPSQTRWLSLLSVVERILEQWEALRLFFIDFTTNPAHGREPM